MSEYGSAPFGKKDKSRKTRKTKKNHLKLCPNCRELFGMRLTGSLRFCSSECRSEWFAKEG